MMKHSLPFIKLIGILACRSTSKNILVLVNGIEVILRQLNLARYPILSVMYQRNRALFIHLYHLVLGVLIPTQI